MKTETINGFSLTIKKAEKGITKYLKDGFKAGQISRRLFQEARNHVLRNLKVWLLEKNIECISSNLKRGIVEAIGKKRWQDIVEAYLSDIIFGTAGIRGLMTLTNEELLQFAREGIEAPVFKGPNTINDVVFARIATAIAKYMIDKNYKSVVIGFDSRLQGRAFAELLSRIFIAFRKKVFFFNKAMPYPEVLFAVPFLKADLGLFISASHNDRRYNGFKICSLSGAPIDNLERDRLYENYIKKTSIAHIPKISSITLKTSKLFKILDDKIDRKFLFHMKSFLLDKNLISNWGKKILVGYSAFHGAGIGTVPKLFRTSGFRNVQIIRVLAEMNGFFPAFKAHPEQQPDPGDEAAAELALSAYKKEYQRQYKNEELDIIIGTDPDVDRASVIVRVPANQRKIYGSKYALLSGDEAWLLVLWYRLRRLKNPKNSFIVLTHTTTDAICRLAEKYGIGILRTWVGFVWIASAVALVWNNIIPRRPSHPYLIYETKNMNRLRKRNIGGFEQSYGFGFFGSPPLNPRLLGRGGHVKDKDGTLGALMIAEVAAYAKSLNKTLVDLIDEIYLDPFIGLFINYYEPDPRYGAYKGIEGFSKKISVLKKALALAKKVKKGEKVLIGGLRVTRTEVYKTGIYDVIHDWKGFPDEGIKFCFGDKYNWLIIRPSGTQQALRLHVQLHFDVNKNNILEKKGYGRRLAKKVIKDFRTLIDCL